MFMETKWLKYHIRFFVVITALLIMTMSISSSYARNSETLSGPLTVKKQPLENMPNVHTLIARAKKAVADDLPTLRTDLDSLFLALIHSTDLVEQYHLIDAIYEIGDLREGSSPITVKIYIQRLVCALWSEVPKASQDYATMKWMYLFPSKKEMERSIEIIAPENRAKEEEGLKVLRARGLGVSFDNLSEAISNADVELAKAVIYAGLQVGLVNVDRTFEIVWPSLRIACQNPTIPADKINELFSLLVENGYPLDYADQFGHTLLFFAAAECSGAIVEHIIQLGAQVNPRSRKGITPLEMALNSERFDVADVLMKHGARLSKSAGKRVLFFPNRDTRLSEYVKRAIEPVKDTVNEQTSQ